MIPREMTCCDRPQVETMDYWKASPADWDHPEKRINRVCSRCWTHWFGPVDAVRRYTREEWDEWIEVIK